MEHRASWTAQCASWLTVVTGWITLEKFAVIVGIATSLGTFLVNWYYAKKKAESILKLEKPDAD